MKRKRKENQIIEVLNQVMGKGGICIHYTLPVVSRGVKARRGGLDRLVYRFFSCFFVFFCFFFSYSLFGLVFLRLGVCWERGLGCLSPHLSVPPGIPYCHSTPRPLTGAQIRDQGISDCMSRCVCVCVCVCQEVAECVCGYVCVCVCVSLKR